MLKIFVACCFLTELNSEGKLYFGSRILTLFIKPKCLLLKVIMTEKSKTNYSLYIKHIDTAYPTVKNLKEL